MSVHRILCAALAGLVLSGCATYDSRYRYEPRPVTTQVTAAPAGEASPLLVSATVIGVRTSHAKQYPRTIEVRLLAENRTAVPVTLRPGSLELVGADLNRLPEPMTEPAEAITLQPGQRATLTAYFPYEDDRNDYDLSGLSLRWTAQVGDQEMTRTANFNLRIRDDVHHHHYYDPWGGWGPGWRFGVGVGHHF